MASIVSSEYPWIYIKFPKVIVIIVNIIKIIVTEINDDIVFLLTPFKKNKIIVLIIKHITIVGIVGLNPHPTIIIRRNNKARFIYIVKNVFKPLLPQIKTRRINNIKDSIFIIYYRSFYT